MIEPGRLVHANHCLLAHAPGTDGSPALSDEAYVGGHERGDRNQRTRSDTSQQRLDRNYAELLQELRVAQIGVQVLFGFLLGCAFTPRFATLTVFQRTLFVVALLLTMATAGLLIAPAAYHRVLFRRKLKEHIVEATNRFAIAGLTFLVCALACALFLVLDMVIGHFPAAVLTGVLLTYFAAWWYAVPMAKRMRHRTTAPRHSLERLPARHTVEN